MEWGQIAATLGATLLSLAVGLYITIGVLKKGQADSETLAQQRHEETRSEISQLRESLQILSVAGEVQAERYKMLTDALQRIEREGNLLRDELKGEIKRHGREIHELQLWRAKAES